MPMHSAWFWHTSGDGRDPWPFAATGVADHDGIQAGGLPQGHGLAGGVGHAGTRLRPFTGDVFIFRSERSDRLKLLVWDGSGLCLITKRLESGAFTWPPVRDGAVTLNTVQLRLLFTGLDWSQIGARTAPMPAE
jgi:transposase